MHSTSLSFSPRPCCTAHDGTNPVHDDHHSSLLHYMKHSCQTHALVRCIGWLFVPGEVAPDEGDAYVAGFSVLSQLAAARQLMGYCPQFEALPGAMTGREVLHMYARLRGVPEGRVLAEATHLLARWVLVSAYGMCRAVVVSRLASHRQVLHEQDWQ